MRYKTYIAGTGITSIALAIAGCAAPSPQRITHPYEFPTQIVSSVCTQADKSPGKGPFPPCVIKTIKSNIVVSSDIDPNAYAIVAIAIATDGTILSRKLIESSANESWNASVLRALDKTRKLPLEGITSPPLNFKIKFKVSD